MSEMITLLVPRGAEGYPICSHGRPFQEYLEDTQADLPRWLVDVTPEAAKELMHKGGFVLYEPQMRRRLSGQTTPLVHDDGPASISFDGDNHQSEERVMPNGVTLHVIEVPSEAVLEFMNSHPGFSVLSIADYQDRPKDEVPTLEQIHEAAGEKRAELAAFDKENPGAKGRAEKASKTT